MVRFQVAVRSAVIQDVHSPGAVYSTFSSLFEPLVEKLIRGIGLFVKDAYAWVHFHRRSGVSSSLASYLLKMPLLVCRLGHLQVLVN